MLSAYSAHLRIWVEFKKCWLDNLVNLSCVWSEWNRIDRRKGKIRAVVREGMIYKVLKYQEIQELSGELRSKLPGTAKVRIQSLGSCRNVNTDKTKIMVFNKAGRVIKSIFFFFQNGTIECLLISLSWFTFFCIWYPSLDKIFKNIEPEKNAYKIC